MAQTTVYIVPAWSDQAGQCRIASRPGKVENARDDYRNNPDAWKDIGIMNSQGRLVCIDSSNKNVYRELMECSPLAAGLTLFVDAL